MFFVVKADEKMMSLYQNVTYGAPEMWFVASRHRKLQRAKQAAKRLAKTARCQVRDADNNILFWGCDL